jgi:hypothetical protein
MSRTRRPVPGTRATLRAALYLTAAALAAAGCSRDAGPAELGEIATVASPAGPGSGQPNLAVGPDGRVHLSWLEPIDDSQRALRASLLEEGGASPPRTVVQRANFFVNWADFPSLAALPGGRLAAHWLERTGSGTYAYGVRISLSDDDGASWSAPITPHRDDSDTEHGFVSLYAEGEVLNAVWLDGRNFDGHEAGHGHGHDAGPGPEMMLLHTTVAPDGTLGAEQRLDARVCDCCQTGVALAADGPIVVYRDRSAEEIRDIYAVRREGGAWSAPRPVHADGWRIEGCPVNGPAIASEGREVAVAWFTGAQDTARVRLAFSDDGGVSFGAPVRIDDGDPVGRVGVVLVGEGTALVSWLERTGSGAAVRVRTVSRDGRLGAVRTVAVSDAARASGFPRMVRSGDRVWFAWTEAGDGGGVRLASAPLVRR